MSKLVLQIAYRYLLSRRAGRYAPLLVATAAGSVAVGMAALIIIMSVMQGFQRELAERFLGLGSHITLSHSSETEELSREQIAALFPGVNIASERPFVQGEVIARSDASGKSLAQGARVRGVEAEALAAMKKVQFHFPDGAAGIAPFDERIEGLPQAIIGHEMVGQLSVYPDFHDDVELIAPLAEVSPSGDLSPNSMKLRVAGLFRSNIYEYDSKFLFVPIAVAKKLLGLQAEEGWQITLQDSSRLEAVLRDLRTRLPDGWKARGWNEENAKLFAALKLERVAMGAILIMALFIASMAIVGVVLLVTASKRRDIAILKTVGMTDEMVGKIFLAYSGLIGGLGSLIGLILGWGVCFYLQLFPLKLPSSYYLDCLPVEVSTFWSIFFALIGVAVSVASSIIPVRQAMKGSPVEALRYE